MTLPNYPGVIESVKKYKLAKVALKDECGQLVQVDFENDEDTNEKDALLFRRSTAPGLRDGSHFDCKGGRSRLWTMKAELSLGYA